MRNYIWSVWCSVGYLMGAGDTVKLLNIDDMVDDVGNIPVIIAEHGIETVGGIAYEGVRAGASLPIAIDEESLRIALGVYWDSMQKKCDARTAKLSTSSDADTPLYTALTGTPHVYCDRHIQPIGGGVALNVIQKDFAQSRRVVVMPIPVPTKGANWRTLVQYIGTQSEGATDRALLAATKDDIQLATNHYHELVHARENHMWWRTMVPGGGYALTAGACIVALARRNMMSAARRVLIGGAATKITTESMLRYQEYRADVQALAYSTPQEINAFGQQHIEKIGPDVAAFAHWLHESRLVPGWVVSNPKIASFLYEHTWWLRGVHMPPHKRAELAMRELEKRS